MRSRFVVPARKLHKSEKLTLDQLALVETLAIGCHAVNRAGPQADEQVLVIGAGPIGLSVIEFVKLTGAKITVLDLNDRRLEFCRKTMGVHHTVLSSGDRDADVAAVQRAAGDLPTVVFDATGSVKSMNNSFHFAGHTGRVVFVGIVTADVSFPDPLLHAREITLYASRNALPADFKRIIKLIEDGRIDTRPWITHRCAFDAVAENFPAYTKPETGVIKAMVELE
jgi:alcohol dehydrogenase